jgi:phosphoribosylanthranilate isomerase
MALKTFVKAGRISNLSDARYCAGMGVDMLGFQVIESAEYYVDPARFQEFRGWFTGPQVVAEIYGLPSEEHLREITERYAPDFLECSLQETGLLRHASLPLLISASADEIRNHGKELEALDIRFVILPGDTPDALVSTIATHYPVLLSLGNADSLEQKLSLPIRGVALSGTPESKPGIKTYESLADVLEALDEEAS